MPTMKLQRYRIILYREPDGRWMVAGYWEIPSNTMKNRSEWSLDGAPQYFSTRKEALEFCLNITGVPE